MSTDQTSDTATPKKDIIKYFKVVRSQENDVRIGISPDHMQAYLSLDGDLPGRYFTVSEIMDLLEEEKIVHGIMREAIDEIISTANQNDEKIRDSLIVEGNPVEEGINTYVDYHFNSEGALGLQVDEEGNIDFKELNIINNVKKDDLLATLVKGKEGKPGLDIYGSAVTPALVKIDIPLAAGKNVRISEDGLTAYAERDGQVFLKRKLIEVSPLYTVPHDVDLNTGNISFNGSVVVNGNVLAGFKIRAKEDVSVMGVVEAADITAGGNIFIKGGIKGNDRGKVLCKGDLITSFIESGIVECHGDLRVNTSIVNSKVTCYGAITMGTKKGQIVGGEVISAKGIECKELGSKFGIKTIITIGDKPLVRARLDDLSKEHEAIIAEYNQILNGMKQHERLFLNLNVLPEEKKKPLVAIMMKKEELQSKIKAMDDRKDKLTTLYNMRCISALKVSKYCHPNIVLTIGHSHKHIKELSMNSKFTEDFEAKSIMERGWR